jgi:RNA polymerase sigma-70 factor (ECF subfamily)
MAESDGPALVRVPGSFEILYQRDYAKVVALVYGMTGSRWVAEDLAQEAFLRTHREWARVEQMQSPGGWVRRVALNLAKSRWRRLRAEATAKRRLASSGAAASPDPDPESEAFWNEVRRLPSRQAQVLTLHYVEELSVAEIADVLDVARGTVRALLHQGRDRLRRQLTAKGLIDEV